MANQFIIANIIPTGVKADIGEYVGDATPATNVIAAIADKVISHPNHERFEGVFCRKGRKPLWRG